MLGEKEFDCGHFLRVAFGRGSVCDKIQEIFVCADVSLKDLTDLVESRSIRSLLLARTLALLNGDGLARCRGDHHVVRWICLYH